MPEQLTQLWNEQVRDQERQLRDAEAKIYELEMENTRLRDEARVALGRLHAIRREAQ